MADTSCADSLKESGEIWVCGHDLYDGLGAGCDHMVYKVNHAVVGHFVCGYDFCPVGSDGVHLSVDIQSDLFPAEGGHLHVVYYTRAVVDSGDDVILENVCQLAGIYSTGLSEGVIGRRE